MMETSAFCENVVVIDTMHCSIANASLPRNMCDTEGKYLRFKTSVVHKQTWNNILKINQIGIQYLYEIYAYTFFSYKENWPGINVVVLFYLCSSSELVLVYTLINYK